jgi:hypothetical protein
LIRDCSRARDPHPVRGRARKRARMLSTSTRDRSGGGAVLPDDVGKVPHPVL